MPFSWNYFAKGKYSNSPKGRAGAHIAGAQGSSPVSSPHAAAGLRWGRGQKVKWSGERREHGGEVADRRRRPEHRRRARRMPLRGSSGVGSKRRNAQGEVASRSRGLSTTGGGRSMAGGGAPSRGGVRRGRACAREGEKGRDLAPQHHLGLLFAGVGSVEVEKAGKWVVDGDLRGCSRRRRRNPQIRRDGVISWCTKCH